MTDAFPFHANRLRHARTLLAALLVGGLLLAPPSARPVAAATWGPEQEISSDLASELQTQPALDATNGRVHVVWEDRGDGDSDIFYRLYDGNSWQPEVEASIDTADEWQYLPAIAVEGSEVHVVWISDRVYYRRFDGATWQPPVAVSATGGGPPSIAVENGRVSVVWSEGGGSTGDIDFRHFDGTAWSAIEVISTDVGTERQDSPDVAVRDGRIHVVWVDEGDGGGDRDIHYRFNDSIAWQPVEELSLDEPSFQPRQEEAEVAVAEGNVYVVWENYPQFGNSVTVEFRERNGTAWEPIQYLSSAGTYGQYPSIAARDGLVVVAWQTDDIVYRVHDGRSWQPEETVGHPGFGSNRPIPIAVDGRTVHLAWEDRRGGDGDIYYRSGVEGPAEVAVWEPGGTPGQAYNAGSRVTVAWSVTDDHPLPTDAINITYGTEGNWIPINGGTYSHANDGEETWDTTGVPSGTYALNLSVTDAAGEVSFDLSNFTVTIREPQEPMSAFMWAAILLGVVGIVAVPAALAWRRRRKRTGETP